jgi:hypothetical protein
VELSLKAYIPVYEEVGKEMSAIDYVASTRQKLPSETLRAYRNPRLCLEPEICPGDTIIVDTGLSPVDGDLVVIILGGDASLKHYRIGDDGVCWFEDRDGRDYGRRLGNALARKNSVRFTNGLMVTKAEKKKHSAIAWQVVKYQGSYEGS